jgi:hypothetical protein
MQVLGVLAIIGCWSPALAQQCEQLRFQRGASSGTWEGLALPDGLECFEFGVRPGQRVSLRLAEGADRGVGITVVDLGDMRDRFDFVAERSRYRILVGFWARAAAAVPYSFTLVVGGS